VKRRTGQPDADIDIGGQTVDAIEPRDVDIAFRPGSDGIECQRLVDAPGISESRDRPA
jgi:hypothetical protein